MSLPYLLWGRVTTSHFAVLSAVGWRLCSALRCGYRSSTLSRFPRWFQHLIDPLFHIIVSYLGKPANCWSMPRLHQYRPILVNPLFFWLPSFYSWLSYAFVGIVCLLHHCYLCSFQMIAVGYDVPHLARHAICLYLLRVCLVAENCMGCFLNNAIASVRMMEDATISCWKRNR